MSSSFRKGYFVDGQFVAEGSPLDLQLKQESIEAGPSKTQRKAQSTQLQELGEQLIKLPSHVLQPLNLPTTLLEALTQLSKMTDFGAQRRQRQFIGKLMRKVPDSDIGAIEATVAAYHRGSSHATFLLHQAQDWRERLIADDHALTLWIDLHPNCDVQQLRALIRQTRKDQKIAISAPTQASQKLQRGFSPRKTKSARELFGFLRDALSKPHKTTDQGNEHDQT